MKDKQSSQWEQPRLLRKYLDSLPGAALMVRIKKLRLFLTSAKIHRRSKDAKHHLQNKLEVLIRVEVQLILLLSSATIVNLMNQECNSLIIFSPNSFQCPLKFRGNMIQKWSKISTFSTANNKISSSKICTKIRTPITWITKSTRQTTLNFTSSLPMLSKKYSNWTIFLSKISWLTCSSRRCLITKSKTKIRPIHTTAKNVKFMELLNASHSFLMDQIILASARFTRYQIQVFSKCTEPLQLAVDALTKTP